MVLKRGLNPTLEGSEFLIEIVRARIGTRIGVRVLIQPIFHRFKPFLNGSDVAVLRNLGRPGQVHPEPILILERFLDFEEDSTPGLVPIASQLIEKMRL